MNPFLPEDKKMAKSMFQWFLSIISMSVISLPRLLITSALLIVNVAVDMMFREIAIMVVSIFLIVVSYRFSISIYPGILLFVIVALSVCPSDE